MVVFCARTRVPNWASFRTRDFCCPAELLGCAACDADATWVSFSCEAEVLGRLPAKQQHPAVASAVRCSMLLTHLRLGLRCRGESQASSLPEAPTCRSCAAARLCQVANAFADLRALHLVANACWGCEMVADRERDLPDCCQSSSSLFL